jgi:hypothetical protein
MEQKIRGIDRRQKDRRGKHYTVEISTRRAERRCVERRN